MLWNRRTCNLCITFIDRKGKNMIKSTFIKLFISALVATTPVPTTAYTTTGIYYADSQTVVDASGEEWGFDTDLDDGTPVIITFDSQDTDNRYDDGITSVTAINE